MKIRKIISLFAIAAGVPVLFSACNISVFPINSEVEAPRYYVLSDDAETASDAVLPAISFGRISIPSYLDVPQIVTRNGNLIARSETHRWGEPLARAVARALALRCAVHAASADGKIASDKASRIQVVFERLDGEPGGNVEISALYTLFPEKSGNAAKSLIFKTSVPVEAPNDYTAYVRALSRAIDSLAADIVSSGLSEK